MAMVSDKPWRLESVVILILGVLLGVVLGGLLGQTLQPFVLEWIKTDQSFFNFILNLLSFYGVSLLLLTVFLHQHGTRWSQFVGAPLTRLLKAMALALLVGLLLVPVALSLNKLCYNLIEAANWTPEQQIPVKILKTNESWPRRIWFGISAVVFAPLVEESLFRGVLYPLIKQQGYPRAAVWVTSLFFALIHFNLMTFVPLTVVALVLVWLYEFTDALLAPILAHGLFNLVNFLLLVYDEQVKVWYDQARQYLGW
jgi:membrane protease YdiL (CAAX protease family)